MEFLESIELPLAGIITVMWVLLLAWSLRSHLRSSPPLLLLEKDRSMRLLSLVAGGLFLVSFAVLLLLVAGGGGRKSSWALIVVLPFLAVYHLLVARWKPRLVEQGLLLESGILIPWKRMLSFRLHPGPSEATLRIRHRGLLLLLGDVRVMVLRSARIACASSFASKAFPRRLRSAPDPRSPLNSVSPRWRSA